MILLAACAIILTMHAAYGQQLIAEPTINENINAELNLDGIVYVTHEISNEQLDSPVALLDGTVSKIQVTDADGKAIEYMFSDSDGINVVGENDHVIIKYEDATRKKWSMGLGCKSCQSKGSGACLYQ